MNPIGLSDDLKVCRKRDLKSKKKSKKNLSRRHLDPKKTLAIKLEIPMESVN
jgi:hypothetical protein